MKNPNRNIKSRRHWQRTLAIALLFITLSILAPFLLRAQIAPTLTITSMGTNQMSVTITNNIGTWDYDLEWTPVLANANYPWTYAAVGVPGGTNFIIETAGYPAGFYRAILDTNAVPLWEAANPANPASPILKVTIASPANGSNLN